LLGSGQLLSTRNPRYGDNPWQDDVILGWASIASDRPLPHGHYRADPEISCSNNNSEHDYDYDYDYDYEHEHEHDNEGEVR
jgi:hypothetical protein